MSYGLPWNRNQTVRYPVAMTSAPSTSSGDDGNASCARTIWSWVADTRSAWKVEVRSGGRTYWNSIADPSGEGNSGTVTGSLLGGRVRAAGWGRRYRVKHARS